MLPCSGNSRSPAVGSGRNFPPGRLALLPGGFLASSAALSMSTCQGSSGPFWLGYCLLLMHHEDGLWCPAADGRKAFFPPRWASKCLRGFFAFLCSIGHGPLPGLLWATSWFKPSQQVSTTQPLPPPPPSGVGRRREAKSKSHGLREEEFNHQTKRKYTTN